MTQLCTAVNDVPSDFTGEMKNTRHIFSVRVRSRWVLCPTRPKMLDVRAQVVYLWDRNPAEELDWDTLGLVQRCGSFIILLWLPVTLETK